MLSIKLLRNYLCTTSGLKTRWLLEEVLMSRRVMFFSLCGLLVTLWVMLFVAPTRYLTGRYYRWWADQIDPPPSQPTNVYEDFFNSCRTENTRLENERYNLIIELQKYRSEIEGLKKQIPPPLIGTEPRELDWLLECPWPPSASSFEQRDSSTRMVFDKDKWGRWFCRERPHL